jgi:hypothetical protein
LILGVGGVTVLLFVVFPANMFGGAGLCSFVMFNPGSVPVLLPPAGGAFVVPGRTLIMLPGGSVPVLLLGFVAFPAELSIFGEAGLCTLVMGNVGSVLLPGFVAFPPGAGRHATTPP